MRKNIFGLLLFLSISLGYSQTFYSNYLDETSEWRYYSWGFNVFSSESFYTIYFDGTENIGGYTYYKEYWVSKTVYYDAYMTTIDDAATVPNYVREDNLGRFYRILNGNSVENEIFNNQSVMNVQVGDLFPGTNPTNCTVAYVNTENLNTRNLKRINGPVSNPFNGWVEGVGYISEQTCSQANESLGGLTFYTKQGNSLQFYNKDFSLFPTPVRNNLNQNSQDFNSNAIAIYPNPTSSIVNIKNNFNIKSITLYDTLGRLLVTKEVNQFNFMLDISNQNKGIYLLKVVTDNGGSIEKIVKE